MSFEISKIEELEEAVFSISKEEEFTETALNIFQFQYANNALYKDYCNLVHCVPTSVKRIDQIPFLPITFFKSHKVQTTDFEPEIVFESSGTTGSVNSKHRVKKLAVYKRPFLKTFISFYGQPSSYCILGLLPSYLERGSSSLVYMVKQLMEESGHPSNGFFLSDFSRLTDTIVQLEKQGQKTLLIGVTYALLDFAAAFPMELKNTMVMETGGMKGRREELIRSDVHLQLRSAFNLQSIHSEYGMTELLSQAYAKADGRFTTPNWMKILIREEDDQKNLFLKPAKPITGALNVIDLANIYSCSFLATEDIARLHPDGSFEVLGRMDNSDIRGCSLLAL
jgi:hypothetical protein